MIEGIKKGGAATGLHHHHEGYPMAHWDVLGATMPHWQTLKGNTTIKLKAFSSQIRLYISSMGKDADPNS